MIDFGSDNHSGVHPTVLQAVENANRGHCTAYGDDRWTERAGELFRETFGEDIAVLFTMTGTGSNTVALKTVTDSFHAVICTDCAHINVDECGAPEKFTGCKLHALPENNGKIDISQVEDVFMERLDEHQNRPRVVSITQSTELGTVYRPDEIRRIADFAHEKSMLVHMDGARIANAAVSLDLPFRAFTRDVGVDILSFGGTKNGLLCGEALVFFDSDLMERARFFRKQAAQLFSKMRFVSCQFEPYFTEKLWEKNARHANDTAALLAREIRDIPEVTVTRPVESNAVFARLPKDRIPHLQQHFFFHVWDERTGEVRLMTSFDTEKSDIHTLSEALKKEL